MRRTLSGASSAGNTRGLIEASWCRPGRPALHWSSAGNTRGLIEACGGDQTWAVPPAGSSAGNTRGLIEAARGGADGRARRRLPRGIPAASLKQGHVCPPQNGMSSVFRGEYPAASLKRHGRIVTRLPQLGLPRGIPAASLKRHHRMHTTLLTERLPRGIPAASLKLIVGNLNAVHSQVFRGEYPRPH